jgi:hypothetical protein
MISPLPRRYLSAFLLLSRASTRQGGDACSSTTAQPTAALSSSFRRRVRSMGLGPPCLRARRGFPGWAATISSEPPIPRPPEGPGARAAARRLGAERRTLAAGSEGGTQGNRPARIAASDHQTQGDDRRSLWKSRRLDRLLVSPYLYFPPLPYGGHPSRAFGWALSGRAVHRLLDSSGPQSPHNPSKAAIWSARRSSCSGSGSGATSSPSG